MIFQALSNNLPIIQLTICFLFVRSDHRLINRPRKCGGSHFLLDFLNNIYTSPGSACLCRTDVASSSQSRGLRTGRAQWVFSSLLCQEYVSPPGLSASLNLALIFRTLCEPANLQLFFRQFSGADELRYMMSKEDLLVCTKPIAQALLHTCSTCY